MGEGVPEEWAMFGGLFILKEIFLTIPIRYLLIFKGSKKSLKVDLCISLIYFYNLFKNPLWGGLFIIENTIVINHVKEHIGLLVLKKIVLRISRLKDG